MAANNVSITPDYRLTADERNYTLQRRYIVDPTRSPWFKPGMDGDLREEWRDAGYYSLNAAGLSSAIQAVVIRTVNAATEAESIAELLAEYQAETARLSTLISAAMTAKLGAPDTPEAIA